MITAESLEQAVERLPPGELAELRRWFAHFYVDAWDAQIEADAGAGKLEALAEEALVEYRSGQTCEM